MENVFLALKHHSIEKKCFSWRLGQFFLGVLSENIVQYQKTFFFFYLCYISTLFPLQVFTSLWIYWVRFKTRLAKGPILELAGWTAKSTKSKSLIWPFHKPGAVLKKQTHTHLIYRKYIFFHVIGIEKSLVVLFVWFGCCNKSCALS